MWWAIVPLRAQQGSFAPGDVKGSADDPEAFQLRSPLHKSANWHGPVPSNRWWSALLVRDEVKLISPFPLSYSTAVREYPAEGEGFGLAVSRKGAGEPELRDDPTSELPGNRVRRIMTRVQPHYLIWNGAMDRASTETRLVSTGDWHIVTETKDARGLGFTATIAAGSPFTYYRFTEGQPRLRLNSYAGLMRFFDGKGQEILTQDGSYQGDSLRVQLKQPVTQEISEWAFFAEDGTRWERRGEYLSLVLAEGKDYLHVAALPDAESFSRFYEHAYARLTGTRADFAYNEAKALITTDFVFQSQSVRKGFSDQLLTTLFPHQYKHMAQSLPNLGSYPSLRGQMKLWVGKSFQTQLRNEGILPGFDAPEEGQGYSRSQHQKWMQAEDYVAQSYGIDTYGTGKSLLRAAQSLDLSHSLGLADLHQRIKEGLHKELSDWFRYSPGNEPLFWGDQKAYKFFSLLPPDGDHWGQLIGWRASYGAQALNDVPLHYGYWIAAAATLVRYDPEFLRDYGRELELLMRHVATPDRKDPYFPYLRPFDPYTGRSYASGYYYRGDYTGNDLESTSEVLNAWQAIFQWGQITGQKKWRDLGLYLYWTERSAVEQYWYDVDGDVLHPELKTPVVPLLREGATEIATHWGAKNVEELYGIQFIPLNASTLHAALQRPWLKRLWSSLTASNKAAHQVDFDTWHGTMLNLMALVDADAAVARFRFDELAGLGGQSYNPMQDHETWSLIYHFIHSIHQLGQPTLGYYANTPSYGVFAKNDELHGLVFNPSPDQPLDAVIYRQDGSVAARLEGLAPRSLGRVDWRRETR